MGQKAIMKDNKGIEGEYVNGDLNDKFKPRFKQKYSIYFFNTM